MRYYTALLTLLALGCSRPAAVPEGKPTSPIALEARIVGNPDAPFTIEAEASSDLDAEIDLEVILPESVSSAAGERRARGKRVSLRCQAYSLQKTPCEILVTATAIVGGARMTRVVSLPLHGGPEKAAPKRGTVKTNSKGEKIIEFDP